MNPNWISGNEFWYKNQVFGGHEFILIDIDKRSRKPAFDHKKLATALSNAKDTTYNAEKLPFQDIEFVGKNKIKFYVKKNESWIVNITDYSISGPDSVKKVTNEIYSPDRSIVAYSQNENLWIRDINSGKTKQLSKDGEKHHGYAVVAELSLIHI